MGQGSQPPAASDAASVWARRAALAGLVVFVAAGVAASLHQGAWIDEGYSLATTAGSLTRAVTLSLDVERQPPLYFVLLVIWRTLGRSLFFARLLSVALAAVGMWSFARAIRTAAPRASPWLEPLSLLIVAAHPFVVLVSFEARGYALQLAIGCLLAAILLRGVAGGRLGRAQIVATVVLGVLGTYTQYFVGLAAAVVFIAARSFGLLSTRALVAAAVTAAVACLPLLPFLHQHLEVVTTATDTSLLDAAWAVLTAIGTNAIPPVTKYYAGAAVVLSLVLAVIAWGILRARPRPWAAVPRAARAALLALALAMAVLCVPAVMGGESAVRERYLVSFFPLAWAGVVLLLEGSAGSRTACAVLALLAALAGLRSAKVTRGDSHPGGWRMMSTIIEKSDARVVYAFPPEEALAGRVELGDQYRVLGFPRDYDATRPLTLADVADEPPNALAKRVAAVTRDRPFWLTLSKRPALPKGATLTNASIDGFLTSCTELYATHDLHDSVLVLGSLRASCVR